MNSAITALCLLGLGPSPTDSPSVETTQDPKAAAAAEDSATASATEGAPASAPTPEAKPPPAEGKPPAGADPAAPLPKPGPPPGGVAAVGSGSQAPLPPPLPAVDPNTITEGPWRGKGWVALRLTVSGPIGGQFPGRSRVVALGGAGEAGWRVSNWLGFAAGLSRRPYDRAKRTVLEPGTDAQLRVVELGHLTNLDFATGRLFWPLDGRVQPFADVGGGLAILEPPNPSDEVLLGGSLRIGAGFDAWVARTVTLGGGILYRANFVDGTTGHDLGGHIGIGLHW